MDLLLLLLLLLNVLYLNDRKIEILSFLKKKNEIKFDDSLILWFIRFLFLLFSISISIFIKILVCFCDVFISIYILCFVVVCELEI